MKQKVAVLSIIIIVLGVALDVGTTLGMTMFLADQFVEANPFLQPHEVGGYLLVQALYLLVYLIAPLLALRRSYRVSRFLRLWPFARYVRGLRETADEPDTVPPSFVRAQFLALAVVFSTAIGLARMLAGINNLMEFFVGGGFVRWTILLFPSVPISILVVVLYVFSVVLMLPLAYYILRKAALREPNNDNDEDEWATW